MLDIMPNGLCAYTRLHKVPNADNITSFARIVSSLNEMNLVLITNIRHDEIKEAIASNLHIPRMYVPLLETLTLITKFLLLDHLVNKIYISEEDSEALAE